MAGKSLLADRLRDELLEEMTSAQLRPGDKLPPRKRKTFERRQAERRAEHERVAGEREQQRARANETATLLRRQCSDAIPMLFDAARDANVWDALREVLVGGGK